ncbi:MAG: homocysteine S-methyltransferase family protein [Candidatus Latescibacterota bacterium]
MQSLREKLHAGIVCLDGAVGTVLADRTGQRTLAEALLLTKSGSEIVRTLHLEYMESGADAITTNSFAANRISLERAGIAVDVAFLNERAVRVAKEAAGDSSLVAGSVGPLNLGLQRKDYTERALEDIYREQIDSLVEAGVDVLKLETFIDPVEAISALRAAFRHDCPVIFHMRGWRRGQERRALSWSPVLRMAETSGALAVGCNCAPPRDIADSLSVLRGMTTLPLSAQPNSGTPQIERGFASWQEPAEGLEAWYLRYLRIGARIVGGCCGTTPGHMRTVCRAVREASEDIETPIEITSVAPFAETVAIRPPENPLRSLFAENRTLVSVEIRAGSGKNFESVLEECAALPLDGVDVFDVPDNPGAGVGRDSTLVAIALQERCGILTIPHRATTHTNAIQMQSSLLAAWDMGVKGILAVTGDVPQAGDHQGIASRVADLKSSVGLLRLIESLNEGKLITGKTIASPCDFVAGCAFNPNGPRKAQVSWLQKKVESGACFVFTQPVFDEEGLEWVRETAAEFEGIRFFAGILPLSGARQARSLADGRIPGIHVPERIVGALERFPDSHDQKRAAAEMAAELTVKAAHTLRGVYLIPPFSPDGMEIAARIIASIK